MGILQRARKLFRGPDRRASRERRRLKRVACHQSFVCTRGEESFPLTVVDVGFGGFKVQSEHPLGERGDLLHLRRVATDFRRHLTGPYTTGLMVSVAWVKACEDGTYEAGFYLPQAPGSMRINWFRELLSELGMNEREVFSKRASRRHRCRLPAKISQGAVPQQSGFLLDLSEGGAQFASEQAAPMGQDLELSVTWGREVLSIGASVVGVRPNEAHQEGAHWVHSLKFEGELSRKQERVLYGWLEELAKND